MPSGISSTTVQTAERSASPECVCGVDCDVVGIGITGRRPYCGCEIGWMNDCGAPATSDSSTSRQSSPTVLSTIAQPCSRTFPARSITTR